MVCCICKREVSRGKITFDENGKNKAEYCLHCTPKAFRESQAEPAKNMFENFRLDNVRDERGQNVVVNSLKELREAEKRHSFALACMSDDDISKPPQHEPDAGRIDRGYKRKFNRNPAAYGDTSGVEAGVVEKRSETLADHPNPLNH